MPAVSQADSVPAKALTDALKRRFPKYKILDGKADESKPVIDNRKVRLFAITSF